MKFELQEYFDCYYKKYLVLWVLNPERMGGWEKVSLTYDTSENSRKILKYKAMQYKNDMENAKVYDSPFGQYKYKEEFEL